MMNAEEKRLANAKATQNAYRMHTPSEDDARRRAQLAADKEKEQRHFVNSDEGKKALRAKGEAKLDRHKAELEERMRLLTESEKKLSKAMYDAAFGSDAVREKAEDSIDVLREQVDFYKGRVEVQQEVVRLKDAAIHPKEPEIPFERRNVIGRAHFGSAEARDS